MNPSKPNAFSIYTKPFLFIMLALSNLQLHAQHKKLSLVVKNNQIYGIAQANNHLSIFKLETQLGQTQTNLEKITQVIPGKIERFRSIAYYEEKASLHEIITQTAEGIHWEIEISGNDHSWTAPIEPSITWSNPKGIRFWTSWSDNHTSDTVSAWQDPFENSLLNNLRLKYGGVDAGSRNAFVIPIATSILPALNADLSFVESLSDTILGMELITTKKGKIGFLKTNHRIHQSNKIHFAFDIVLLERDWRAGVAWVVKKYPQYFLPENARVATIAGGAAYSSYEGKLDVEQLKRMSFSMNWKASLDFPYMGLFVPPTNSDSSTWVKYKQGGVTIGDGLASIARLRSYSESFRKNGFHTVSYFNIYEAGNNIQYPIPKRKALADSDLWKDPNDFIYYQMQAALLRPASQITHWNDCPVYSNWENSVVMDPAEPKYQDFLIEQARLQVSKINADGICIDRMDWADYYNGNGDDGISYFEGKETRSLVSSWNQTLAHISPILHQAGKVIFSNPLCRRIDLMQHVDGIYDEYGNFPTSINLCAQLAFLKPIIAWTRNKEDLLPNPDAYLQRYLYLGSFLTIPFPGNDHTITPDADVAQTYLAYGPLFNAMKGRRWLLVPNIISVEQQLAKANIFMVGDKLLIPVIFGSQHSSVQVSLHLPAALATGKKATIKLMQPGDSEWRTLKTIQMNEKLILQVPLRKGCALISIGADGIQ